MEEREHLVEELYGMHQRIFKGPPIEESRRTVVEPDAVLTKIFAFREATGRMVGYLAFHVFQVEMVRDGHPRRVFVFRTQTGVLRAYRGGAPITRILLSECWKFSTRKVHPEAYFVVTLTGPQAYATAHRGLAEMYPRPGVETPASVAAVMHRMASALGLVAVSSERPGVKQVAWAVTMSPAQRSACDVTKIPPCAPTSLAIQASPKARACSASLRPRCATALRVLSGWFFAGGPSAAGSDC